MRLIKLIHPTLGLCAQQVIHFTQTEFKIRSDWKYKYGKKFNECNVVIENTSPPKLNIKHTKNRKVVNIHTGDVYNSIKEASETLGVTHQLVYQQCQRKYSIGFEYKFRYA